MPPLSRVSSIRLTGLTAGVLVATVLGVPGQAVVPTPPTDAVDALQPGTLTVGPTTAGEWDLGPLQVTLSAADGLLVQRAGRTVWRGPTGRAFVLAGRGDVSWQESRGYFWPTVTYADRLTDQSVDSVAVADDSLTLTGTLSGAGDPSAYELTLRRGDPGVDLSITTEPDGAEPLTSTALVSGRTDGAGVHGLGEQFADFDLDGRLMPIVDREQGVGRGEQPITALADLTNNGAGGTDQMTYAAWPTFVTDDLRGLALTGDGSTAFATADMRAPGAVSMELWQSSLTASAVAGRSPAAVVRAQQGHTKRRPLAGWARHGAIIGLQGGTAEVRRKLGVLRRAGTDVSGVWLQDWTGQRTTSFGSRLWWTWQLDRQRYPHWRRLVSGLAEQGIRTTTYVNPFVVDSAPKGDPSIRNLYAEARDRGYLVRDPAGDPYALDQGEFDAYLVDLTNPEARSWFADVIADDVLAHGVKGFMADFAEGLPYDAVLAHGSPATLHNRWPLLWARTARLGCRRADVPRCVTWLRAGAAGQSAAAPLFWNGDQLVTWGREDGLASALLGSLSAGVSGWPLTHSDIGGYTSVNAGVKDYVRTEELLRRWTEYQAFGVVMRTHEGNRPDANPQVYSSRASARAFARMTRLFRALQPYRDRVVRQSVRTGLPAIRSSWMVAPGSAAAASDSQFFLGSHLLVAPVLQPGVDSVDVLLPPGTWVDLLSGKRYRGGGATTVPAPLGHPAAFLRASDHWTGKLRHRVIRAGLAG